MCLVIIFLSMVHVAGYKHQKDKRKRLPIHYLCELSDVLDLVEPLGEGLVG